MRSLSLLVVTLAVLQLTSALPWSWFSQPETTEYTKPDFCKSYECPKYKVLKKFNGYELREYMPSVWASTPVGKMTGDYWENTMFTKGSYYKLLYYFSGVNDRNVAMDRTVPVVKSHAKSEVWMNFMIPSNYSANPPTPTDKTVEIYNAKTDKYYVRTFGGWSTSENMGFGSSLLGYSHFPTEFEQLKKDLDRDNEMYIVDPMFFTAEYNTPWQIFGRHNEVWIMQK